MSHASLRHSQNFLRHPHQVGRLLDLSGVGPDDLILEIGPGTGLITDQLARRCRQLVAVEKDGALATRLRCRYASHAHVAIHTGDFLEFPLPDQPYKIFANIPFNITHDIVTKLTSAANPPQEAYLIMQREAASKFCGVPREYLYAVLLKPWFEPDILYHFQRSDFAPAPHVDVVMLRMRKRGPPLIAPRERQLFRDFAVYCFVTRRPSLDHILRDIFTHHQRQQARKLYGIDLSATPSAIPFPQWLHLFRHFVHVANLPARQIIDGSERQLREQQAHIHKTHRTCLAKTQGRRDR
jgi:23S rRNA (adenine-N6)-dimethyltransferase